MIPTPVSENVSLVTCTLLAEGAPVSDLYQVYSVETCRSVNKVPYARILLIDGSAAESDFAISDQDVFVPGKTITIKAGYDSKETVLFKGIVVRHAVKIQRNGDSFLELEITDKALKMTLQRKNDLYPKIKDGDLIGQLISANGLSKDVESTTFVNEEIVQYCATDWDLMLLRAEVNGLLITVDDGKVTVRSPDTSQTPVLEVGYGDTILDLQAELDASTQIDPAAVKGYSWDPATLSLAESGPGTVNIREQGNLSSSQLAKVFGIKNFPLQSGGDIAKESLKDWAAAGLQKSKLAKIRGWVKFQGNAAVLPGKMIRLTGIGDRFSGDAFISAVHHTIENGDWVTEVQFGMAFTWFSEQAKYIPQAAAAGQLPPIKGLQTGIVKKVDGDPGGEFRVLVNLPLLQNKNKSIWTRLGTLYAGKKRGTFFFPEPEDEVIVGFLNEDPRFPVILGSLYSKKMSPPFSPDAQNNKKAIVTREKLQISFDDKDKIIEIRTPGGHIIKMDDKSGALSIKDPNSNTVSLSKGGITLDSDTNLKINAKGNISLAAKGNIGLSAKGNLTLEGAQISNSASAKFSAKGNAAAELTATGMVTVKGGMVKIN